MEELKQIMIQYWPTIVEYAMLGVSYFLVFLYRSIVVNTKDSLTTLFKDNAAQMKAKLAESKADYDAAISQVSDLKARLEKQERIIKALIGDCDESISTNTEEETTNS